MMNNKNDFIEMMKELGYKVRVTEEHDLIFKKGLNPEVKMSMSTVKNLFIKSLTNYLEIKSEDN